MFVSAGLSCPKAEVAASATTKRIVTLISFILVCPLIGLRFECIGERIGG